MLKDYILLSFRSLGKRRLRSWLTMVGIFIGIAAVVSLISLGEGLRNAVFSQFSNFGADVLTIQASGVFGGPPGFGAINPLADKDVDKIGNIARVKTAIGRLIRSAKIEFNNKIEVSVAGSMPDGNARREVERIINLEIDKGRNLKDGDKFKVVLGNNYLKDDKFGKPIAVGSKVKIQDRDFEVIGILKKKGSFFVDDVILINEGVMKDVWKTGNEQNLIVAVAKPGADMKLLKEDIEKLMRKERKVKKGEEDFTVQSAENVLRNLNDILFAVQLFVYVIAGISLLVGGIGIMNTMYTSVLERTKEIGIMKAIGAKNSAIFTLFFIESGLLGMVGGSVGVLFGVAAASGLAFIGSLVLGSELVQAHFTIWLTFGALLFSFFVGTISGLAPALAAARLHPVDALHYTK